MTSSPSAARTSSANCARRTRRAPRRLVEAMALALQATLLGDLFEPDARLNEDGRLDLAS